MCFKVCTVNKKKHSFVSLVGGGAFYIWKTEILDKQLYIYFLCGANIAKGESAFMTTYKKEIFERKIHNKIVTIVNLTPELSCDERKELKKNIERKLYDVFCKYY